MTDEQKLIAEMISNNKLLEKIDELIFWVKMCLIMLSGLFGAVVAIAHK